MNNKNSYISAALLILCGMLLNYALSNLCISLSLPLFLDCVGTLLATALGGFLPGAIVGFMGNLINGLSDPITLYYGIISIMIAFAAGLLARRGCFEKIVKCIYPILVLAFIGGVVGSCLTWLLYGGGIGSGISAPYAIALCSTGLSEFWAQLIADVFIDLADKTISVLLVFAIIRLLPQKSFDYLSYAQLLRNPEFTHSLEHRDYRVLSLRTKVITILVFNSLVLSAIAIIIGNFLYRPLIVEKYTDALTGLVQADLCATDIMIFNIKLISLLFGAAIVIVMVVLIYCDTRIVAPINTMTRITEDLTYDDPKKKQNANLLLSSAHISTGDEIENLYQSLFKMSLETESYIKRLSDDADYIAHLQNGIIMSFADMVESRDENTGEHVKKTSAYVRIIAEALKNEGLFPEILTEQYIEKLVRSAPLHDLGKIKISDAILNKPGKLTDDEFNIMKTHAAAGKEIIERMSDYVGTSDYLDVAAEMAGFHHERWNGKGYPEGLVGSDIPLSARIMAIADVLDALGSKRSYKEPFSFDETMRIIREEAGRQFDPQIISIFDNSMPAYSLIRAQFLNNNFGGVVF